MVTAEDGDRGETLGETLKERSIRGVAWTLASQGGGELLRLGSNLVLTRLLVPEYFGIALLMNLFMAGLNAVSEVGIGASIVYHERGDDERYLNTAWTIQVVRGVLLWIAVAALSGVVAGFYEEPALADLLPVAGVITLFAGLTSTNQYTLNRRLHLGRITAMEIGAQIVSVAVMVTWAWFSPTVWALAAGPIANAAVRCVWSHVGLPGIRNHFAWDVSATTSLIRFGRWLFLSTALGFLASRGQGLVLGVVLSAQALGVYSIARVLSTAVNKVVSEIAHRVLFPLYAELARRGGDELRARLTPVRGSLLAITVPALCVLSVFGTFIVELLWPEEYADAGWMLQILAAGMIVRVVYNTALPVLLAHGDSLRHLANTATRAVVMVACILVGYSGWGTRGAIIGLALEPLLSYPVMAWTIHRYGVWQPGLDAAAVAVGGGAIALGLALF